MIDIARLQIQINSDGIRVAGRELDSLAQKGRRAGQTLTTRLTLPLVAGMAGAVREAALLEGAFDKFDVVFRGMNDEMREFVELYNEEFPLARREIVQHSAALQDLLVPMGLNRELAAEMTKEWMELAGALSAFNDVPIERVLQAIRGGIAGEAEALRRYGIDVRKTALEQVALQEGLMAVGEEMSEQVRVQAALIQATNQSADALGGLEEQKGSLLWQIEELKAEIKDMAAELGVELLPIVKDATQEAISLLEAFGDLDQGTKSMIVQMSIFAAAFGPVLWGLSATVTSLRTLGPLLLANPWTATAAGVGILTTHLVRQTRQLSENRDMIEQVLDMQVSGTEEEFQAVSEAIAKNTKELGKLRDGVGAYALITEAQHTRRLRELKAERRELTGMLNDIHGLEQGLSNLFPQYGTGELLQFKENFAEIQYMARNITPPPKPIVPQIISDDFTARIQTIRSELEGLTDLHTLGVEMDLDLLTPEQSDRICELNKELERLRDLGGEVVVDVKVVGLEDDFQDIIDIRPVNIELEPFFDPGSIGFYEQAITNLERQITATTDEEARNRMQIRRDELQEGLNEMQVMAKETKDVARDMGWAFSSAFEDAVFNVREFNDLLDVTRGLLEDIARVALRSAITEPLGQAIGSAAAGLLWGDAESVDDMLLTKDGQAYKTSPEDHILAMKDFSPIVNASAQAAPASVNVNVNVENQASNADVDVQQQRGSNGDVEVVMVVKDAFESLADRGQLDRAMGRNFGVRRRGVNYG